MPICVRSTYPILVTTPNFQNVQIWKVLMWKFVAYKLQMSLHTHEKKTLLLHFNMHLHSLPINLRCLPTYLGSYLGSVQGK